MDNDSSNTLFFIVGGLVVAALIYSFVYFGKPRSYEAAPETINPAAGEETPASRSEMKFDMKVNDQGVQGTITDTGQQQPPQPQPAQ